MAYWYPPGTGLAPAPAAPTGGVGAVIAAAVTAVWAVTVTVALQVVGWLVDQVLITTGSAAPGWAYPVGAVANAALVAVPAVLLATLARAPGVRAAG
ncbi:MAG TPA: peptidase S8, partial [Pilimelia sp.]|nr:peptidase S8 [Pilimelia sp.]